MVSGEGAVIYKNIAVCLMAILATGACATPKLKGFNKNFSLYWIQFQKAIASGEAEQLEPLMAREAWKNSFDPEEEFKSRYQELFPLYERKQILKARRPHPNAESGGAVLGYAMENGGERVLEFEFDDEDDEYKLRIIMTPN